MIIEPVSISAVLASFEEAVQVNHFNVSLRKYKKELIESHTLLEHFRKRVDTVIAKHASPSDVRVLQEMLEDLDNDRRMRIEFLKASGKTVTDDFSVPHCKRVEENNIKKREERISKTKRIIMEESSELSISRRNSLIRYKKKRFSSSSYTTYEDAHNFGFDAGADYERNRILDKLKGHDSAEVNALMAIIRGESANEMSH